MVAYIPTELLTEIGVQLGYTGAQNMRLVSKRFNDAVESFALSPLELDWPCSNDEGLDILDVPLDKIEAYTNPGVTRAFTKVRHLTMRRICLSFDAKTSTLDGRLGVTNETEPTDAMVRRADFFRGLMRGLFQGEAFKNLRSVTWIVSDCICSIQQDSLDFAATLLAELTSPLEWLEINCPFMDGLLPKPAPWSNGFPLCKQIKVRGLTQKVVVHESEDPTDWRKQVAVAQYQHIQEIDIDLCFDEELIRRFFPRPKKHEADSLPQFCTLSLLYTGFEFQPHVFGYLRGLRTLDAHFYPTSDNRSDWPTERRRLCMSNLWKQLSRERIYLEDVSIATVEVDDALLDYLVSYPQPTLKSLCFFGSDISEGDGCSLPIPGRFFREVLPVIAPTLQSIDVTVSSGDVNDWYLGKIPEASANFKLCHELYNVVMPIDPDCVQRKALVQEIFGGLPQLRDVFVHSLYDDLEEPDQIQLD